MKGGATGTWVTHKIQQVLNPSRMPMTMDKFKAEVDLVFVPGSWLEAPEWATG